MEQQERIVVGADGSEESVEAVRWAVRQAALTGATVQVVTAWEVPMAYGAGMMIMPDEAEFDAAAKQVAEQTVRAAAAEDGQVQVERTTVMGHPARVLTEAAEGAALLVLGGRGRGGFKGMLLGSVSQHCVANGPCPVVVVRTATAPTGPR
ncbi:Nucleotide-binding universal stress protein, UspA family [Glycomyces sambucus]|uniref:Nucleotide-binding universal stress protein, UspA family n=1 Tax=Glycomyces sambucus TaxID=380244 RepID=A0A1G9I4I1_9ACTN|nr:universal stress protein [Glycomyces sambucus]SDL20129.1 Nucleotide-binding universal stress protein, UspA family [Glycomyces sambucus]